MAAPRWAPCDKESKFLYSYYRLLSAYAHITMFTTLIQSIGWTKTAVRSSLVPHAVLLMPLRAEKCILVVQKYRQKAVCESRHGHLWSSTWCFWVVHECNFHVQEKSEFQLAWRWSIFPKMITTMQLSRDLLCRVMHG